MTNPHPQSTRNPPQDRNPQRNLISRPSDADSADLAPQHYQEPAVRRLQKSIAQAGAELASGEAAGLAGAKWPNGLVTAGVISTTCLLWLLIVASIRLI